MISKTLKFLSSILPAFGKYVSAVRSNTPDPSKENYYPVIQKSHDTVSDLANTLHAASTNGQEAYYAMASFNGWRDVLDANGLPVLNPQGKPRRKLRTCDNIVAIKTLFMDIDCGIAKAEKGEGYTTKAAALAALDDYLDYTLLPYPMVVDSGNGLHLYWPLSNEESRSEWQPVADRLKATAEACGFLADPAVTADAARILRPVGMHNWKVPKREDGTTYEVKTGADGQPLRPYIDAESGAVLAQPEVKIIKEAEQPSFMLRELSTILIDCCDDKGIEVVFKGTAATKSIRAGWDVDAFDSAKLVAKCAAVRDMRDHSYQGWYYAMALLSFTNNGREMAHALSKGVDTYDEVTTDDKLNEITQNHKKPPLCSTLEAHCDSCEGCSFSKAGREKRIASGKPEYKMKSPIMLGKLDAARIATVEVSDKPAPVQQNDEPVIDIISSAFLAQASKTGQQVQGMTQPAVSHSAPATEAKAQQTATPAPNNMEVTTDSITASILSRAALVGQEVMQADDVLTAFADAEAVSSDAGEVAVVDYAAKAAEQKLTDQEKKDAAKAHKAAEKKQQDAADDAARGALADIVTIDVPITPAREIVGEEKGVFRFRGYVLEHKDFILREGQGVFTKTTKENEFGELEVQETHIFQFCPYMLYTRHLTDNSGKHLVCVFRMTGEVTERNREVAITSKDLRNLETFSKWMFDNYLADTAYMKEVYRLMHTYVRKLQNRVPYATPRETLGWTEHDDGTGRGKQRAFVLGGGMLVKGAKHPTPVVWSDTLGKYVNRQGPSGDRCMGAKGTLSGWKAIPEFYKETNDVLGQAIVLAGFASPLLAVGNEQAKNGHIHLYSEKGGSGKSTLQQVAMGIWGEPDSQILSHISTSNSVSRISGLKRHLPMAISEVTNTPDDQLSELVYNHSEGMEKDRLSEGGRGMVQSLTWNSILLTAANKSLVRALLRNAPERDAEVKRVIEICLPPIENSNREHVEKLTGAISRNHGVAGPAFIQHLLDNEEVIESASTRVTEFVRTMPDPSYRFWYTNIGVILAAGEITNSLGLTDFNLDAIRDYLLSHLEVSIEMLKQGEADIASAIGDLLNENLLTTLIMPNDQSTTPLVTPRGCSLNVRINRDARLVDIRASVLRDFCKKRNISVEAFLSRHKVVNKGGAAKAANITVSKGWAQIPNRVQARGYTIELDQETVDSITAEASINMQVHLDDNGYRIHDEDVAGKGTGKGTKKAKSTT